MPISGSARSSLASRTPSSAKVGGIRMSVTTTSGRRSLMGLQGRAVVAGRGRHLDLVLAVEDLADSLEDQVVVLGDDHPNCDVLSVSPVPSERHYDDRILSGSV